jgi:chaperonin GroES
MSQITFKPLEDRVLVQPINPEDVTKSGIIIPDAAKEKPQRGIAVAVGSGRFGEEMTVSKGNVILYGKNAGAPIQIEGDEYLIMRESDIYGVE